MKVPAYLTPLGRVDLHILVGRRQLRPGRFAGALFSVEVEVEAVTIYFSFLELFLRRASFVLALC